MSTLFKGHDILLSTLIKFIIAGMADDIKRWVMSCDNCEETRRFDSIF